MLAHDVARGASWFLRRVHVGLVLRGIATPERGLRLVGTPQIHSQGRVVLGRGVALLSEPLPVRLTVGPGGSVEIGEGAVIGSGTTIVARGRVRIGARAELGPGCVITDVDSANEGAGVEIGEQARLEGGVTLLGGAVVARGAHVVRGTILGADGAPDAKQAAGAGASNDELLDRLRRAMGSVVSEVTALAPDEDVKLAGGWDSLSAIHVLVALESEFGVTLPSSLFEQRKTLRALAEAVGNCVASDDGPSSQVRPRIGL